MKFILSLPLFFLIGCASNSKPFRKTISTTSKTLAHLKIRSRGEFKAPNSFNFSINKAQANNLIYVNFRNKFKAALPSEIKLESKPLKYSLRAWKVIENMDLKKNVPVVGVTGASTSDYGSTLHRGVVDYKIEIESTSVATYGVSIWEESIKHKEIELNIERAILEENNSFDESDIIAYLYGAIDSEDGFYTIKIEEEEYYKDCSYLKKVFSSGCEVSRDSEIVIYKKRS